MWLANEKDLRDFANLGGLFCLLQYLQHASSTVGEIHPTEAQNGTTSKPRSRGKNLS